VRPTYVRTNHKTRHPDAQAGRYNRLLEKKIALCRQAVHQYILPFIDLVAARSTDTKEDELKDATKDAKSMVDKLWNDKEAKKELTGIGKEVSTFNAKQLAKSLHQGPQHIGKEEWVNEEVRRWTDKTNTYVDAISDDLFEQLKTELAPKIEQGARWEELVDVIEDRLSSTESRAETIARTEIAHFNLALNQTRQEDLGVTEYTWRTMNDSRVRDSHAALDGEVFMWGGDGDPEEGHPGEMPNCRCFPDPVLPEYNTTPLSSEE
jgi:SPP1 gp7 family putative phage head morphogenesis protein